MKTEREYKRLEAENRRLRRHLDAIERRVIQIGNQLTRSLELLAMIDHRVDLAAVFPDKEVT